MSQSVEGVEKTSRIIIQEPVIYDPEHVDIVNDFPVPIINGYVVIKIGTGSSALYVKQKVVRMKNTGATNTLKKPTFIHNEIIEWFRKQPIRARYSVAHVHEKLNEEQTATGHTKYGFSTIQGRFSELLFHRVLELVKENGENFYVLDRAVATKVLTEGRFF